MNITKVSENKKKIKSPPKINLESIKYTMYRVQYDPDEYNHEGDKICAQKNYVISSKLGKILIEIGEYGYDCTKSPFFIPENSQLKKQLNEINNCDGMIEVFLHDETFLNRKRQLATPAEFVTVELRLRAIIAISYTFYKDIRDFSKIQRNQIVLSKHEPFRLNSDGGEEPITWELEDDQSRKIISKLPLPKYIQRLVDAQLKTINSK